MKRHHDFKHSSRPGKRARLPEAVGAGAGGFLAGFSPIFWAAPAAPVPFYRDPSNLKILSTVIIFAALQYELLPRLLPKEYPHFQMPFNNLINDLTHAIYLTMLLGGFMETLPAMFSFYANAIRETPRVIKSTAQSVWHEIQRVQQEAPRAIQHTMQSIWEAPRTIQNTIQSVRQNGINYLMNYATLRAGLDGCNQLATAVLVLAFVASAYVSGTQENALAESCLPSLSS